MTREDEDKMTQERYALGPNGKRITVEQALARAERAESQLAVEHARGVAAERARVVADLRRQAGNWERHADVAEDKLANEIAEAVSIYLNRNADRIERGEHDKEGT